MQPRIPPKVSRDRIDGAVSRALGNLASRFLSGQAVTGFGNRPVPVLRQISDQHHTIIVEAVNLAAEAAEKDADALTSRLLRIREGGITTVFLVGYLASATGLNGETALKDWIEHKLNIKAFDLTHEKAAFRKRATEEVARINDALAVFP